MSVEQTKGKPTSNCYWNVNCKGSEEVFYSTLEQSVPLLQKHLYCYKIIFSFNLYQNRFHFHLNNQNKKRTISCPFSNTVRKF